MYHSTLGSRLIKKKKKKSVVGGLEGEAERVVPPQLSGCVPPPRSLPLERKVAWGSMGGKSDEVGNSDVW